MDRGSGVSIPVTSRKNSPGSLPPPQIEQMTVLQQQYAYSQPPMSSYYPQPGHILVNPPGIPTYQYGIPPSPMMVPPMGMPPGGPMHAPPPRPIRRAGSFNAKMYSADARRPFAGAGRAPSEAEYLHHLHGSADVSGWPHPDHEAIREEQEQLILEHLKENQGEKNHEFTEKMRLWNRENGEQYSVHKREQGELPGLMIEEMMESASQTGENHCREVAIRDQDKHSQVGSSVLGNDQFSGAVNDPSRVPTRWKHSTPMNTVVLFVPQQEAWVVERMGKFHRTLEPGLNLLIPIIDRIRYVQSLKEITIEIPQQSAISLDNVTLNIDGVLYLRIMDPYKASYGVEDPEFAITQLAQTLMRSEIGKINMDTLFKERDTLNSHIVKQINAAAESWGIQCMRYEIRDIRMPPRVQEAMQMQVEAERKKRAAVLESEGIMAAEVNIAEGKKKAQILQSEAEKMQLINEAQGHAQAVVAAGEARAKSLELVSAALSMENGHNAASLAVAEKYVTAFSELARTNNTLILPANAGDVSGMVAQAMTIYQKMQPSKPEKAKQIEAAGDQQEREAHDLNLD